MKNLSSEQLITQKTNVKAQITSFPNHLNAKKSTQLTLDEVAELTYKLDQFELK